MYLLYAGSTRNANMMRFLLERHDIVLSALQSKALHDQIVKHTHRSAAATDVDEKALLDLVELHNAQC
jgi:hypothetical protein